MAVPQPQDYQYRTDVTPVDVTATLEAVLSVPVVQYRYLNTTIPAPVGPLHVGPYAQTNPASGALGWNQAFPDRVPNNPLLIDLGDMAGTIMAAVQGLYGLVHAGGLGGQWAWNDTTLEPNPGVPGYTATGTLAFPASAPAATHALAFSAQGGMLRAGTAMYNATAFGTDSACIGNGHTAAGTQSTVCGGKNNSVLGNNSTVCAGNNNTIAASGTTINNFTGAIVGGGSSNFAGAEGACVLAGVGNSVLAQHGVVCAGVSNSVTNERSGILAGESNTCGRWAGVLAGSGNTASGDRSAVVAGSSNGCSGAKSLIGVGTSNRVVTGSDSCCVLAGFTNTVSGSGSVVLTGGGNKVYANNSSVVCGTGGTLSSGSVTSAIVAGANNSLTTTTACAVLCGRQNSVGSSSHSAVLYGEANAVTGYCAGAMGSSCTATGVNALAAGTQAYAQHDRSVVVSAAPSTSPATDTVTFCFTNGHYFRTLPLVAEPQAALLQSAGCWSTDCDVPATRTVRGTVDGEVLLAALIAACPVRSLSYVNTASQPTDPWSMSPTAADFYAVVGPTGLQYVKDKDEKRIECMDLAAAALAAAEAAGVRAAALKNRLDALEALLTARGVIGP